MFIEDTDGNIGRCYKRANTRSDNYDLRVHMHRDIGDGGRSSEHRSAAWTHLGSFSRDDGVCELLSVKWVTA